MSCMVLFIACCDNVTGGRWGKPSCFCREPGGSISGGEGQVEADALEREAAGIE
jgi:hypothetical protein